MRRRKDTRTYVCGQIIKKRRGIALFHICVSLELSLEAEMVLKNLLLYDVTILALSTANPLQTALLV